MERIRKYLKWLANIIPQAKSIAIMREIIFSKGEAVVRAIIYLIQAVFIGIVLISVVDYLTNLLGIENEFAKNIIFVALYSMYIASNIFDVILQLDKLREEHDETVKKLQYEINNTKEKYEKEIDSLENYLIACKYARMDCEKKLRRFESYYDKMESLFEDIKVSKNKVIPKNWLIRRYMKIKNSFDSFNIEMMPYKDFHYLEKTQRKS